MEAGGGGREFVSSSKSVDAMSFRLAVCMSGSCSNTTRCRLGKDSASDSIAQMLELLGQLVCQDTEFSF